MQDTTLCYNTDMAAKVTKTDELQQALEQEQGAPVYLVGLDGKTTHVVLPIDDARHMFDDYLRRELQVGFDQADRGESAEWNVGEFLERAHKTRSEQS